VAPRRRPGTRVLNGRQCPGAVTRDARRMWRKLPRPSARTPLPHVRATRAPWPRDQGRRRNRLQLPCRFPSFDCSPRKSAGEELRTIGIAKGSPFDTRSVADDVDVHDVRVQSAGRPRVVIRPVAGGTDRTGGGHVCDFAGRSAHGRGINPAALWHNRDLFPGADTRCDHAGCCCFRL